MAELELSSVKIFLFFVHFMKKDPFGDAHLRFFLRKLTYTQKRRSNPKRRIYILPGQEGTLGTA